MIFDSNPEMRKAAFALAGFILFSALVPFPKMGLNYPLAFRQSVGYAASFLSLCSLFLLALFYTRAGRLDSIRAGKGVLARWIYSSGEWQAFAYAEYASRMERNKGTMVVLCSLVLLAGLFFFMINSPDGLSILVSILVLVILISVLCVLTPHMDYVARLTAPGEIIISVFGVVVVDRLYLWDELGSRFHSVHYCSESPPMLEFIYSGFSFMGSSAHALKVPVPEGQVEEANQVVQRLNPSASLPVVPRAPAHVHVPIKSERDVSDE